MRSGRADRRRVTLTWPIAEIPEVRSDMLPSCLDKGSLLFMSESADGHSQLSPMAILGDHPLKRLRYFTARLTVCHMRWESRPISRHASLMVVPSGGMPSG